MSVFLGKIVCITGAASGIGRGIAESVAKQGATVIATDRDGAGAELVAAAIRERGGKASASALDVTDAAAMQAMVDGVIAEHGRMDYFFNNAGIGFRGEVRDATLAQWKQVLDVNLMGVIYGIHAVYPYMVQQRSGHIVNTASLSGLIVSPALAPYSASKHAVVGLSRALRVEGAELGVKVTALCPGFLDTNIYASAIRAGQTTDTVRNPVPMAIHPLDAGVAEMLLGVERNEELVVLPRAGRIAYFLSRFAPGRLAKIGLKQMRRFRRYRVEPKA